MLRKRGTTSQVCPSTSVHTPYAALLVSHQTDSQFVAADADVCTSILVSHQIDSQFVVADADVWTSIFGRRGQRDWMRRGGRGDYEHLGLSIAAWSVSSPILVSLRVFCQRLCFASVDWILNGRTTSLAQNAAPVMRILRLWALCSGRVIGNYFRVVEPAMWRALQAMQEILSFDRMVRFSVGVGKPCYCGQGSRNTTSEHVSLSLFMQPAAAHYFFLGRLSQTYLFFTLVLLNHYVVCWHLVLQLRRQCWISNLALTRLADVCGCRTSALRCSCWSTYRHWSLPTWERENWWAYVRQRNSALWKCFSGKTIELKSQCMMACAGLLNRLHRM